MKNSFGQSVCLTIFGESHGAAVGCVIDGLAPGIKVDEDFIARQLTRRRPSSALDTPRQEKDEFKIISGVFSDRTTGTPLTIVIPNENTISRDYNYGPARPAHADFSAYCKYHGFEDYRGGGHFSGRLTAPLCIAGGLCLQYLAQKGIHIGAHILSIGSVRDTAFDPVSPALPVGALTLDPAAWEKMQEEIAAAKAEMDSVGGVIECAVTGVQAGYGEPMFGGMENRLAQILFGIPAVKGVEFGAGFGCTELRGSQNNDPYYYDENGFVRTRTNHAGGIAGGISTGMPIVFRAAFKPTPSIARPQETIRFNGTTAPAVLEIKGRHDPCIVPRAVPVVEAAAAIAILDAILEGKQWN